MRAHRAVPVRPVRQRLVELEHPAHRQMPHRVAPRGRHRRHARGSRHPLVQKRRSRDDVRVREGERVGDECAQLGARGRVGEDAAGDEASADGELGADGLLMLILILSCGRYGSVCMRSVAFAPESELGTWNKKRARERARNE